MSTPRVVVVGSCMVDLISYAPRLPQPGETLIGNTFQQGFGGKGANQCVSACRLGAHTALVARVGKDSFGEEYVKNLTKEGVDTKFVTLTSGAHTGMAQITVAESGENQIVIVPGANCELSAKDVAAASSIIESADVLLFQLETPIETTIEALKLARGKAKRIVNAAPAISNPDPQLYIESDIFCVNETEELGCSAVVVTLGAQGAVYLNPGSISPVHIPSKKVQPVDTTGAGDAFVGAMAYYLAYHPTLSFEEVILRSCTIASISVQTPGTQTSFPYRKDLSNNLF